MSSDIEIKMGKLPKEWNQAAKSITFCVTEDCNLACKYCYMTGKNKKNKMSFEVARKAVDYILSHRDQFKEEAVIWEFVGGEPFLEMELIDRICDYIKQRMFLLGHPWFDSYRFNFSTNGILYNTPAVQKYIWKNRSHVSIGISIDGNKIKHDLQRVRPDGSGSFDDVVKNVPLWLEQFPAASTKSTFSHDDLPHLKDSIIALWDLGIDMVAANVVFEDVWHEGDDLIFEEQLRALADYIIDNHLYYDYSVRFFDPQVGNSLTEDNLNSNYCGSGKMLAIDCNGNFYPCIRFYDISLTNRKGYKVGDIHTGINEDRLRPFQSLNLKNQSTEECINCEVGRGCAWCSGCNYNFAETDTIYQRATYICKMHKANVRANEYFWNKFSLATGLPSEKEKLKQGSYGPLAGGSDIKFMQIMMADDMAPSCNYRNERGLCSKMSKETFKKSLEFCKENGFIPVFLGDPGDLQDGCDIPENSFSILNARNEDLPMNSIAVHDNCFVKTSGQSTNCILIINKENLDNLGDLVEDLSLSNQRINIIPEDIDEWTIENLDAYEKQLDRVVDVTKKCYQNENSIEINVLTDIWNLGEMCNCGAGENSFVIAPNGKIYHCPAFYFDDPESHIGTLDSGIDIKNSRLLDIKVSLICSSCDVYSCKRCKFLNKSLTGEICVPSRMQCLIAHLERKMSLKLQKMLQDEGLISPINILKEISYADPLDLIKSKNARIGRA